MRKRSNCPAFIDTLLKMNARKDNSWQTPPGGAVY